MCVCYSEGSSSSHQVHRKVRVVIRVRGKTTSTPQDPRLKTQACVVCVISSVCFTCFILLNVTSGHSDRWTVEETPIFVDLRLCRLSPRHVDYGLRLPSTLGL